MLRLGTTTSNYFTTLHVEACKVLVDVVEALGQRAVIGKVCMDQHGPDFYLDTSPEASVQGARDVVSYIQVGLICEFTNSIATGLEWLLSGWPIFGSAFVMQQRCMTKG